MDWPPCPIQVLLMPTRKESGEPRKGAVLQELLPRLLPKVSSSFQMRIAGRAREACVVTLILPVIITTVAGLKHPMNHASGG